MSAQINQVPHEILKRLNATKVVMLTTKDEPEKVFVSTHLDRNSFTLDPAGLKEISGFEVFSNRRKDEDVYSIMMLVLKLDIEIIEEAASHLDNRYRVMSELDAVLQHNKDVYVVYVVTHYNAGPLGPLTINIGGDCYRTGKEIKDLESILDRTKGLAEAMLRKAVMIFPDIPALHGGKKGEWIILDRTGKKIDGISEEAIVTLGSVVIPRGIAFLNNYKESKATDNQLFDKFPARNYIRPDTGSPDVVSGIYWRGDRKEKPISMCHVWAKRGPEYNFDMSYFTCLPSDLGGTKDSSARPTGYGVATTTIELSKRYFEDTSTLKFLLEAAGNVGRSTIEALIEDYGIRPENITVFDKDNAACDFVKYKFRVNSIVLNHDDFYQTRLPEDVANGAKYDVWINNSEGNNTTPAHVESILRAGVKVFCGGANDFLLVDTQEDALKKIFAAGGWAWPDSATSGGGWTLAVMDVYTRCQGKQSNTSDIQGEILRTIMSRNLNLVKSVFASFGNHRPEGERLWQKVNEIIQERVDRAFEMESQPPHEAFRLADVTGWKMTL